MWLFEQLLGLLMFLIMLCFGVLVIAVGLTAVVAIIW